MSNNQDSKLKIAWKTASGTAYGAGVGIILGLLGEAETIGNLAVVSAICAAIGGLFCFADAVDDVFDNNNSDDQDKPDNHKPQPKP